MTTTDPMRQVAQGFTPCGAKTRSGKPCPNPPMRGATRCRQHGGASPAAQAKAAERLLEARIAGELAQVGIEPVTNPIGHLAELGGEVLAWLELCRRNLEYLRSWEFADQKQAIDIRPLVAVYERALDRAVSTMERMARLGLDAETLRRQLQLEAERPSREQATGLQRILSGVLDGLDLTSQQRAQVPALLQTAMEKEGLL